ncbi:MAG: alanine racemase [Candidatus Zixiibacteriota bacterium]
MNKQRNEAPQKTWVEIDVATLRTNLRCLHEVIGPHREMVLIVKSDAYGHGAVTVAAVAAAEGVRHFAVAAVAEAAALRNAGITHEIVLLHPPLEFEVPATIELALTPTLSDESTAMNLNRLAGHRPLPVHVEINTGLNRLGFDWQTAVDAVSRITTLPHLRITGIFTHFRAAHSEGAESVRRQMERFQSVLDGLKARRIDVGFRHVASSLAVVYHPETCLDGIRPGMIVYGGMSIPKPSLESEGDETPPRALAGIRPVMSVRTRVLHVLDVRAGEWVHYGDAYQAERPMRVAVLPIGYGMGYSRHFSNNGWVLIRGRRVPVVGVVGMDMTMVEVGKIPVAIGDVVTLLGRDGPDEITAVELAEWVGTIPYEITCRLGNALPRIVTGMETGQPKNHVFKHAPVP